jgi:hypothetical protein
MFDVLRHFFLPPSPTARLKDQQFVQSGGRLMVSASDVSDSALIGGKPTRLGHFIVTKGEISFVGRGIPYEFDKDSWTISSNSSAFKGSMLAEVSFVNRANPSVQRQFRVPKPDVELLQSAMN